MQLSVLILFLTCRKREWHCYWWWNSCSSGQNHGCFETGAIHGGEDTSQVSDISSEISASFKQQQLHKRPVKRIQLLSSPAETFLCFFSTKTSCECLFLIILFIPSCTLCSSTQGSVVCYQFWNLPYSNTHLANPKACLLSWYLVISSHWPDVNIMLFSLSRIWVRLIPNRLGFKT